MIKDKLVNAKTYFELSDNIKKGLEWLKSHDLLTIECKKYQIDGDNIYANVQEYETKEDANYEAHREYIDIQYIVKGKEYIGIVDINKCKTCEEYDSAKDIEFFTCNDEPPYQLLTEGCFMIIYPWEAHKPSISPDIKTSVKKVVVKVRV